MASTLKINNIDTASGSTITIPTGKQLIVTDKGGIRVPDAVIQVVQNSTTVQLSQGGTSYADTNLTASITPKYNTSKILVSVNQYFTFRTTTASERQVWTRILRDSTEIGAQYFNRIAVNNSDHRHGGFFAQQLLDSPATTSSITYKTQGKLNDSSADVYFQHDNSRSTITLMEIAQ